MQRTTAAQQTNSKKTQISEIIGSQTNCLNDMSESPVALLGEIEDKPQVKEEQVEVNYILDELKNLKVAKSNARRPMESKRFEPDDSNVRFEVNSALYLVAKEEFTNLAIGQSEELKGVRIEAISKTNHIDKGDNNPATTIKLKVLELSTKFESNATINLYHSNQGVHIQGGRRHGRVTSCSLVGEFLQEFFKNVLASQGKRIFNVRHALINVDLRKNYNKPEKTTKGKQIEKTLLSCPKCDYRTCQQTEMKRHTFKQHQKEMLRGNQNKVFEEGSKTVEPPVSETQAKLPQEEKSECVRCYNSCEHEQEFNNHTKTKHDTTNGQECKECKTKDELISEQQNKIDRLELGISDIEIHLKTSTLENKKITEEKESLIKDYNDASRVIAEQQRKLTVSEETVKVFQDLEKVEAERRAGITNPSTNTATNPATYQWEEVWEVKDDNSGDLVSQRRKEVNKYQWKSDFACKSCDKVFDSDQHLRQHMKCHKRMSNELIPCHHCDFITNDEDILLNHMANIHGTNHTCLTCKMAFTSENERIHHAGEAHGFKYSESKGSNQDIECHDCSDVFNNKFDLMQHKNKMHYKKRLCSYYHGTGWGCRYQSRCLNIHGESITPELSIDIRSRIQC